MLSFFFSFLLGVFCWSFSEYALHNWVGHKGKGKNELSREHLKHHSLGHYFAPLWKKVVAALVVVPFLGLFFSLFTSYSFGFGVSIGFAGMYLYYEWFHRFLHTHGPTNFYGRWARKHHFYHHFQDPKFNHGVTSPLWDYVFGTFVETSQIRVPEKLAMVWLLNPETNEIFDNLSGDYTLARKKGKPA